MKLDRDILTSIPLWIKFLNIHISLLEDETLRRMSSVLGRT